MPDCLLKSARRLSSVCLLSQRVRGPHASRADVTTVSGRDFHFSPHHGGCESEGPGGRQFIICPSPLPGPVTGGTGRHMCAWITSNPPIDGASPSACLPLPLPVRRFDTQEGEHGVLGVWGSIKTHIYSVHQANSRNKTTILNLKKESKQGSCGVLWLLGWIFFNIVLKVMEAIMLITAGWLCICTGKKQSKFKIINEEEVRTWNYKHCRASSVDVSKLIQHAHLHIFPQDDQKLSHTWDILAPSSRKRYSAGRLVGGGRWGGGTNHGCGTMSRTGLRLWWPAHSLVPAVSIRGRR